MLDRILITNDDGIEAPGLAVLEPIAGKSAHEAKRIRMKSLKFLDSGLEKTGDNRRTKAEAATISGIRGGPSSA
jgi:hypothetical protein